MIKVLVIEKDSVAGESIAKAFYNLRTETWLCRGSSFRLPDLYSDVTLPAEFDLLVLHDSDKNLWLGLEEDGCKAKKIVHYTKGNRSSFRIGWIQRKVERNNPLIHEEAKQILEWAEASISKSSGVTLPTILGGATPDELLLRVAFALLPFGLVWQTKGREEISKISSPKDSFEAEVASRFLSHLGNNSNKSWVPTEEEHTRFIDTLNGLVKKGISDKEIEARWETAVGETGTKEPPKSLDRSLNFMSKSSAERWDQHLELLKDTLIAGSVKE